MAAAFSSYSQASFFFAKLNEFIHHWKSGRKASLKIECKEGFATHQMTCNLGYPDLPFIQDGAQRRGNKPRVKSDIRRARDNARAAAYQRARAPPPPPPPPPPPTTHRTAISPAPSSPTNVARSATSPAPTPPAGSDTSPASHTPARTVRPDVSDIWQHGDLDCTMAGARETLPLSPLTSPFSSPLQPTPKRVRFSQEAHREEEEIQSSDSYSDPPHPEVFRADSEEFFCPPSSPLPSLREELERPEDNETASQPPSSSPSSSGEEPGRQEVNKHDFVSLLPFYLSSELPISAANNKWILRLKKRYKSDLLPEMPAYFNYETITTHGPGIFKIPWTREMMMEILSKKKRDE